MKEIMRIGSMAGRICAGLAMGLAVFAAMPVDAAALESEELRVGVLRPAAIATLDGEPVPVEIVSGFELPATGGSGTDRIYAAGAGAMAIGAGMAVLYGRKAMRDPRGE